MGLFGKKKDKTAEPKTKVGFIDKVNQKVFEVHTTGVKGIIDNKIQNTISDLIAEKRLVFNGDDSLEYTSKAGERHDWTFDDMAALLAERSGLVNIGEKLGITVETIKAMITEAYLGTKTIEGTIVDGEIKELGGDSNVNAG